jgi:hypothetical protein
MSVCWSDYAKNNPTQFPECANCLKPENQINTDSCGGYNCDQCFFSRPVELGGQCQIHEDCRGYTSLGQAGNACCSGRCAELKKDWAGIYYCPEVCVGAPFGQPGSC